MSRVRATAAAAGASASSSSTRCLDPRERHLLRARYALVSTVVGAAAIAALAGTATAAQGAPPPSAPCAATTGARACFEAYGDRVWVQDTRADGHHAEAYLVVNGGSAGTIITYCENFNGASTWVVCAEGESIPERRSGTIYALNVEGNTVLYRSGGVAIYTS